MNKIMRRAMQLGKKNNAPEQKAVWVACLACNGSGHYDHNGSPACGACNGTGKELRQPKVKK